jgi:hypothetical protein
VRFFVHHSQADTLHKRKKIEKKNTKEKKKKKNSTSCHMRPTMLQERKESHDATRKKRERRERRRRKKEESRDPRCRADPRPTLIWPATKTLGGISLAFSLVFSSGGFGFFLVFRMIKSQKRLLFPSRL